MHYFDFVLGVIAGVILSTLGLIIFIAVRAVRDAAKQPDDDE